MRVKGEKKMEKKMKIERLSHAVINLLHGVDLQEDIFTLRARKPRFLFPFEQFFDAL